MWSVFPEQAALYLGQDSAMLVRPGQVPRQHAFSATLPLDDILSALSKAHPQPRGLRWRVDLSPAWCALLDCPLPPALKTRAEKRVFAQALAARYWDTPDASHCLVNQDSANPKVLATVLRHVVQALTSWVADQGGRLAHVGSMAASCLEQPHRDLRSVSVLHIHEPDGSTHLMRTHQGATALLREPLPAKIETGAEIHLRFTPQPLATSAWASAPSLWRTHWERSNA